MWVPGSGVLGGVSYPCTGPQVRWFGAGGGRGLEEPPLPDVTSLSLGSPCGGVVKDDTYFGGTVMMMKTT